MIITQTLDKLEEHLAGIIPAFIMLGVVVFVLLGLGASVAPVSALSVSDVSYNLLPNFSLSKEEVRTLTGNSTLGLVYVNGEQFQKYVVPSGTEYVWVQQLLDLSIYDNPDTSGFASYCSEISISNPEYVLYVAGGVQSGTNTFIFNMNFYQLSNSGDDSGNTNTGGDNGGNGGDDSGNTDTGDDSGGNGGDDSGNPDTGDDSGVDWNDETLMDGFELISPIYGGPYLYVGYEWVSSAFQTFCNTGSSTIGSIYSSVDAVHHKFYLHGEKVEYKDIYSLPISNANSVFSWSLDYESELPPEGSEAYVHEYLCSLSLTNPEYIIVSNTEGSQSSFTVRVYYIGVGDLDFTFSVDYIKDSDSYTVTLLRDAKPWYLDIKGRVFGWIPVYTYTTVQDESLDVILTDLPARFFTFDLDYTADIYRLGAGQEGNDYSGYTYSYKWTRSGFLGDKISPLKPEIGPVVDITPIITNPPGNARPGGYDTPGINDIDHDGIHNSEDDDMDGDGIPNEEDDDPYTPGESGLLGNLGFTLGFTLPDIESITDMMRNMKFPASLKEMFNIPLPDEYKAGIAVEEGHVLYGYQQLWFGLGDGVIGLFMGIILVIAALIACIPLFLFEFFSSLIEWLNVAFQSFYDWLVIPSEIFKLVIGLLPDELLAIALLLFGIDLVFLFFRFVIPGLISGSRAVGDIVQKEEEIRSYEDENHGKRRYK